MIEGNRLAGWILRACGITLTVTLHQIVRNLPVYLFGLIPFSIGIVLLLTPFMGPGRETS